MQCRAMDAGAGSRSPSTMGWSACRCRIPTAIVGATNPPSEGVEAYYPRRVRLKGIVALRGRRLAQDGMSKRRLTDGSGNLRLSPNVHSTQQEPCSVLEMLGTILLIVLILLLLGALPTWPYSGGWVYYPSGGVGLLLIVVIVLLVAGRI